MRLFALTVVFSSLLVAACGKSPQPDGVDVTPAPAAVTRPVLMEFGSTKCRACQEMKPIIDGLREELAGMIDVVMVDVMVESELTAQHSIELIPTQIFKDAAGRELFRHTGVLQREAILAKWQEFGVAIAAP